MINPNSKFTCRRIRKASGIFMTALVLALVSLACGAGLNLPVTQIKTGPTQTMEIQVPIPSGPSESAQLNLEFIAGKLVLAPGADGSLASGTATFNAADFEPKLEPGANSITLRSGDLKLDGIPINRKEINNEWDLQLASLPMSLSIQTGAYTGFFELGGLSLEKLEISEGGSDLTLSFSQPNLVEMSSFTYSTGGSNAKLTGLANANFTQMTVNCGAGDYTLSFDGGLQRDAGVVIDAGLGTLNISVPQGANARLTFEGGLTSINLSGGWTQSDQVYTLAGSGPALTITVKMGAGTLNLQTE